MYIYIYYMRWFIFIQKILIFDVVVSNDMRLEYFSGYKSMERTDPNLERPGAVGSRICRFLGVHHWEKAHDLDRR